MELTERSTQSLKHAAEQAEMKQIAAESVALALNYHRQMLDGGIPKDLCWQMVALQLSAEFTAARRVMTAVQIATAEKMVLGRDSEAKKFEPSGVPG